MAAASDDPLGETTPSRPTARLGRDLFWAYAAAGARIGAWVIVSAIVFRKLGAVELGIVALVRATIGILNYAGIGLGPALVHRMAQALAAPRNVIPAESTPPQPRILSYATPLPAPVQFPTLGAFSNGIVIASAAGVLAGFMLYFYVAGFDRFHRLPRSGPPLHQVQDLILFFGLGTICRLISDVPGAVLQTTGRLWVDSVVLTLGEVFWMALVTCLALARPAFAIDQVGGAYLACGGGTLVMRWVAAGMVQGRMLADYRLLSLAEFKFLLTFGATILVAQLADYLYAPTDFILIQNLLGAVESANYAPAVQIDAGLLLLVSGLGVVLLPRAAQAHGRGDARSLRQYYLRGTAASLGLLTAAAVTIWMLAPMIFRLWFASEMPSTLRILPLLLIHTIIGGSSAVGRSILLGMGKVKAFTAAALLAGFCNVVLSYCFVKYAGMGLPGIVLGTICVVIARCAIWMPWYILRVTRQDPEAGSR